MSPVLKKNCMHFTAFTQAHILRRYSCLTANFFIATVTESFTCSSPPACHCDRRYNIFTFLAQFDCSLPAHGVNNTPSSTCCTYTRTYRQETCRPLRKGDLLLDSCSQPQFSTPFATSVFYYKYPLDASRKLSKLCTLG